MFRQVKPDSRLCYKTESFSLVLLEIKRERLVFVNLQSTCVPQLSLLKLFAFASSNMTMLSPDSLPLPSLCLHWHQPAGVCGSPLALLPEISLRQLQKGLAYQMFCQSTSVAMVTVRPNGLETAMFVNS